MDEFKKELWAYIWECGVDVRRYIKTFYTDLRDSSLEHNDSSILYNLAYELACLNKGRLPDHLHNRMLLSSNEWSKKYIEFLESCTNLHMYKHIS